MIENQSEALKMKTKNINWNKMKIKSNIIAFLKAEEQDVKGLWKKLVIIDDTNYPEYIEVSLGKYTQTWDENLARYIKF